MTALKLKHGWASGEVSLISESKLLNDHKKMRTNQEFVQWIDYLTFNRDKEVVESYSFKYNFFHESGVIDNEEIIQSNNTKELYFRAQTGDKYYFLLENYSLNPLSYRDFQFQLIEGKLPVLWYYFALTLFTGLLIYSLIKLFILKDFYFNKDKTIENQ